MPLFNPDKIARLVSEMRKAINRLKSLGTLDKESFLNMVIELAPQLSFPHKQKSSFDSHLQVLLF